jgi:hypothetical protein
VEEEEEAMEEEVMEEVTVMVTVEDTVAEEEASNNPGQGVAVTPVGAADCVPAINLTFPLYYSLAVGRSPKKS